MFRLAGVMVLVFFRKWNAMIQLHMVMIFFTTHCTVGSLRSNSRSLATVGVKIGTSLFR